jgi:hypothetical protein
MRAGWKKYKSASMRLLPHVTVWVLLGAFWITLEFYAEEINFQDSQLIIKIEKPTDLDNLQVFFDLGSGFNEKDSIYADIIPQNRLVNLDIHLPDKQFTALRIDPKICPGKLSLDGMELHARYGQYQWTAKEIVTRFFPWHDIDLFRVDDGLLHLQSSGEDPFFIGPYSLLQNSPIPLTSYNILFSIDVIHTEYYYIVLEGWAFLDEWYPKAGKVFLVFQSDKQTFLFDTFPVIRKDVSKKHGILNRLDRSGFIAVIHQAVLPKQTAYRLGLVVRNSRQASFVETHKTLNL